MKPLHSWFCVPTAPGRTLPGRRLPEAGPGLPGSPRLQHCAVCLHRPVLTTATTSGPVGGCVVHPASPCSSICIALITNCINTHSEPRGVLSTGEMTQKQHEDRGPVVAADLLCCVAHLPEPSIKAKCPHCHFLGPSALRAHQLQLLHDARAQRGELTYLRVHSQLAVKAGCQIFWKVLWLGYH